MSASSSGNSAPMVNEDAGLLSIKSPMVGTFYAKATPDSKPFVTVGSQIDEETDVCVIEAMKVFNNIKAEVTGTITKILVTNGQTVEFGTVLFLVRVQAMPFVQAPSRSTGSRPEGSPRSIIDAGMARAARRSPGNSIANNNENTMTGACATSE